MKNILIYKSEDNLCVTHFVKNLDPSQIAQKAENLLPFGTLYRIATADELPEDRTFREAWDLDHSDYNGIAGKTTTIKKIANLDYRLLDLREQLAMHKSIVNRLQKEQASLVQISSLSFSDLEDSSSNLSSLSFADLEDSSGSLSSLSFADLEDSSGSLSSLSFSDTKSKILQFNDVIQEQQQQIDYLQESIHSLEAEQQENQNTLQQLIDKLPDSPQNDQN